jgi:hypothetical protein
MTVKFDIYQYSDPLRYVGGQHINLNQLSEKQIAKLVKDNPGIVKLIEPPKKLTAKKV